MPQARVDVLCVHLAEHRLTAADADGLVFVAPAGGPLNCGSWRHRVGCWAWQQRGARTAISTTSDGRPRRRSCGRGVDIKTAQTRLRHGDARLTLEVYAQATTEADTADTEKARRALLRK